MNDLISRKDAIYVMTHHRGEALYGMRKRTIAQIRSILESLPSAEHTAYWKYDPNANDWGLGGWVCSHCGYKNDKLGMSRKTNFPIMAYSGTRFCGQCGCEMSAESSQEPSQKPSQNGGKSNAD